MDDDIKLSYKNLKCPRCGEQIEEGKTICSNCGNNILFDSLSRHEKEFNSAIDDYFNIVSRKKTTSINYKNNSNKIPFFNFEDMSKALGILCLLSGIVSTFLFGVIGSAVTLVLGISSIVLGINAKKRDGCSIIVSLTTSIIGLLLSGVLLTCCVACGKYTIGIGWFGYAGGSCISNEIIDKFR